MKISAQFNIGVASKFSNANTLSLCVSRQPLGDCFQQILLTNAFNTYFYLLPKNSLFIC